MYFLIDDIKRKNGAAHERGIRRGGQRVRIEQLSVNKPLIIKYIDDEDKLVVTGI